MDKKDDRKRIRLAVPPNDTQVIEWIDLQSNVSNSVRKLIRESIAKDGMVDIDCKQVVPGVYPGRPKSRNTGYVSGTSAPQGGGSGFLKGGEGNG